MASTDSNRRAYACHRQLLPVSTRRRRVLRRHLNSSQVAIAESKRAKLVDQYASEVEKKKAAAKKRQSEGGGDKRSKAAKSHSESVSQSIDKPNGDGRVATERAKQAGTNRQYIDDADRILSMPPDLAEKIAASKPTADSLSQRRWVGKIFCLDGPTIRQGGCTLFGGTE